MIINNFALQFATMYVLLLVVDESSVRGADELYIPADALIDILSSSTTNSNTYIVALNTLFDQTRMNLLNSSHNIESRFKILDGIF